MFRFDISLQDSSNGGGHAIVLGSKNSVRTPLAVPLRLIFPTLQSPLSEKPISLEKNPKWQPFVT